MPLLLKRLSTYQGDLAPDQSGALKLTAAIPDDEPVTLAPGKRAILPTGLAAELPHGTEGVVTSSSHLANRDGLAVLNSPGTIDPDYRGEIKVILINLGDHICTIRRGDEIATIRFRSYSDVEFVEVDTLSETTRNDRGLGSTGR
jgi:dUTP pyrophosphatase